MKRKSLLFAGLFATLFLTLVSCSKEKNTEDPVVSDTSSVTLKVVSDESGLTKDRVKYIYRPVFDTAYQGMFGEKGLKSVLTGVNNPAHFFYLVGEIASPVFSGNRVLSATHVAVKDNRAYVSYHYNEPDGSPVSQSLYAGQVDVVNITNPNVPTIMQSATSEKADFNTMCLDFVSSGGNTPLWIGATDYGVGGAVYKLNLVGGQIPSGAVMSRYKTPPGKSVNGVSRAGDWLYASAGRTAGGAFVFNASNMQLLAKDEYTNAKYSAVSSTDAGGKHVVLKSGTSAKLYVYSVDANHSLLNTIDVGSIEPEDGKSGIYVKNDICWVSMGYNGLKAFDLNTGAVVHTLSRSSMSAESITNGVSIDEDYVYVANGSGGLYLCLIEPGQVELNVVGVYQYGASANYVTASNGLIFIANGREGLKILKKTGTTDYNIICGYDNSGVPFCLEPNTDPICPSLLSHLALKLPESHNAITEHPEYFANPNKTLVLTEPATVYVTFIKEGASWKNALGLYSFNASTPPVTVSDIVGSKMLVFPNASQTGSGGDLNPGQYIHMIGTFPAGTAVGAFLVANAWRGISPAYPNGLSAGMYTHYTDHQLNLNGGQQQSLLFYDSECDAIILTFEDILVPNGDKDFNDCIFKVIVDPPTAVNTAVLNQLVP